ncbi:MAG: hypothetical protein K9G34_03825, partial [Melioribacteraceae bacterium]|nr:hypothetical protein [Melioribacteraceae bacterium]
YLTPDVLFVADYNPSLYEDVSDKLRFGAQTAIYDIVYLRGGYQYFLNEVEDEKLVLGLGVNLKSVTDMNIMIDYGYMIEDIANSQRFSLSVSL